jgi:hypothetical protein
MRSSSGPERQEPARDEMSFPRWVRYHVANRIVPLLLRVRNLAHVDVFRPFSSVMNRVLRAQPDVTRVRIIPDP